MDHKEKIALAGLGGLAALILLLKWSKHKSMQPQTVVSQGQTVPVMQSTRDPFSTPYYYATPGIADNPVTLNGGGLPFQSTINITANPTSFATLANKYIPLFGFVGMNITPPNTLNPPPIIPAVAPFAYAPTPTQTQLVAALPYSQPPTWFSPGAVGGGAIASYLQI